jgi:hypothetical protein
MTNSPVIAAETKAGFTALCDIVMEYRDIMKRLVDQAKQPGFTVASWAPLAELIAVDEFERVGNFREVQNWQQYAAFLTDWARASEWDSTFRRIHESSGVVYLELEERSTIGDRKTVCNSVSVYEFNQAGKIRHLDIYLQYAP